MFAAFHCGSHEVKGDLKRFLIVPPFEVDVLTVAPEGSAVMRRMRDWSGDTAMLYMLSERNVPAAWVLVPSVLTGGMGTLYVAMVWLSGRRKRSNAVLLLSA